jgi:hypothetical protein
MDLTAVLRADGKPRNAAREALVRYERKGNRVSSNRVRNFLAELQTSRGESESGFLA